MTDTAVELDQSTGAYVRRYLAYLVDARDASRHTIRAYEMELTRFVSWLQKDAPAAASSPDAVDARILRSYLARRAEGGLAHASTLRVAAAIRSFFMYLVRTERLENSPALMIRLKRHARPLPRYLDMKQVAKLVETPRGDDFRSLRDRAILEVFYSAGIRIGELTAIDDKHVDWTRGLVRVLGKGRRERLAILGAPALEALARYRTARVAHHGQQAPENGLFTAWRAPGRRMTQRDVHRVVSDRAGEAGILGRVKPHLLRHAFATHLMEAGAGIREIQEMLGHASINTTSLYTRVSITMLQGVYDRAHPRA